MSAARRASSFSTQLRAFSRHRSSHPNFSSTGNLASVADSRLTIYTMYRRPKFLEVLLDIRSEMAHEVDYDTDLFAEMIRSGRHTSQTRSHSLVQDDDRSSADRKDSGAGKR